MEPLKRRVSKHVIVSLVGRVRAPIVLVEDEYGDTRLQIGDEVVGWPIPEYVYPESIEITSVKYSDGRSFRVASEEIPYEHHVFTTVTDVFHRTYFIQRKCVDTFDINRFERRRTWTQLAVDGKVIGVPLQVWEQPISQEIHEVHIQTERGDIVVRSSELPYFRIPENVRFQDGAWKFYDARRGRWFETSLEGEATQAFYLRQHQPHWLCSGHVDYEMANSTEVGDEIRIYIQRRVFASTGGMSQTVADALLVGDDVEVEYEYAFWKQEDGSVTNGVVTFPRERPVGKAWRQHTDIGFASLVSMGNWPILLEALVGCYFESVNTDAGVRARVEREKVLRKNKDRIKSVRAGACFDPGTFDASEDIEVGVGEKLLFTGRHAGRKVYVVDSPNHGHAMYVFDEADQQVARDWANRRITWQEAQGQARARIVHIEGWQGRAQAALAASPEQVSKAI